jgi:hypothetical protein
MLNTIPKDGAGRVFKPVVYIGYYNVRLVDTVLPPKSVERLKELSKVALGLVIK